MSKNLSARENALRFASEVKTGVTSSLVTAFVDYVDKSEEGFLDACDHKQLYHTWYTFLQDRMADDPSLLLENCNIALHILHTAKNIKMQRHLSYRVRKEYTLSRICGTAVTLSAEQKELVDHFASLTKSKKTSTVVHAFQLFISKAGLMNQDAFKKADIAVIHETIKHGCFGIGPKQPRPEGMLRERSYNRKVLLSLKAKIHVVKSQPTTDDDMRFSTHTKFAPSHMFSSYPTLQEYPGCFAKFLWQIDCPLLQKHVMALVMAVSRAKILKHGRSKDRDRLHRAAAIEVMVAIKEIRRLANEDNVPLSDMLPAEITLPGLTYIAARVVGRYNKSGRGVGNKTGSAAPSLNLMNNFMSIINSWIGHSIFPQIADGNKITSKMVDTVLCTLEAEEPDKYQVLPDVKQRAKDHVLTQKAVERLILCCQTSRERAYVQLSMTSGLRVEAMALLKPNVLWDDAAGEVVSCITVTEKNSVRRIIQLPPQTRVALGEYISNDHHQESPYLFYSTKSPLTPNRDVIRTILRNLCKRASLPVYHHHQWRQYITNSIVERGGGIELASSFLGHRDVKTTYQHYLTAVPDVMNLLLSSGEMANILSTDQQSTGTTRDMEILLIENERLKRRIIELEGNIKRLKTERLSNGEENTPKTCEGEGDTTEPCCDLPNAIMSENVLHKNTVRIPNPDAQPEPVIDLWDQILAE